MKILFLTLARIDSVEQKGIYHDLMMKFHQSGHELFIVYPSERRKGGVTKLNSSKGLNILSISTLNIQKTNVFEKGVSTLLISRKFKKGIKKYFSNVNFDLVLYSTPPITFSEVINFIKKRDRAKTYLLLKDIFPQNAVDLGMLKNNGIIHRYLVNKEKQLYKISDYIGCMSPANKLYLIKNNPDIKSVIEVNPNSISIGNARENKINKRQEYNIPVEATVFIYGGNLGKPQGINFLLDVIFSNRNNPDIFFLIVGSGTEFIKILETIEKNSIKNTKLIKSLPKQEYDNLVYSSDVGLIFLDPRFTIPNFPSRLLTYLENKKPVIAATDKVTDLGNVLVKNGFGYWSENGDLEEFNQILNKFINNRDRIELMGNRGYEFLQKNYSVELSYEIIMKHFN